MEMRSTTGAGPPHLTLRARDHTLKITDHTWKDQAGIDPAEPERMKGHLDLSCEPDWACSRSQAGSGMIKVDGRGQMPWRSKNRTQPDPRRRHRVNARSWTARRTDGNTVGLPPNTCLMACLMVSAIVDVPWASPRPSSRRRILERHVHTAHRAFAFFWRRGDMGTHHRSSHSRSTSINAYPRARACSNSSRTTTPGPSPKTNPSRSRQRRLALVGSLFLKRALWPKANPATPIGVIAASAPPAIMTSASFR